MEGEVGPQVAPPPFLHRQLLPGPTPGVALAKKRGFPWPNHPGFHPPPPRPPPPSPPAMGAGGGWNPKGWDWDSVRFTARRSEKDCVSDALHLGTRPAGGASADPKAAALRMGLDADDENLRLELGGAPYPAPETLTAPTPTLAPPEAVARPNKRVRSGSPGGGGGGSYPMCQVDDCRTDLSSAKDYHRRHKVCEVHSKTTKALVGNQMQRFCQQCSRFHPLSEFDEGKRSCRRRLAGHNRRRRKTQPADVASQLLLQGNPENSTNGNMELVNLLTALARLQGSNAGKSPCAPPASDRDGLDKILSKINSLNTVNSSSRLPAPGSIDLNVSERPLQDLFERTVEGIDKQTVPSTMNLLAVLSAALAASPPEAVASLSNGSADCSGNGKSKTRRAEPPNGDNSHDKSAPMKQPVQELKPCLRLQLFGSAENGSPPKMDSTVKYLSSESSNLIEERSLSSSPPVTRKFFPLHSSVEDANHVRMAGFGEDASAVEASRSRGWCMPLELFRDSGRQVENAEAPNASYPVCTSSSASDHSPSTSNSDSQDRTGRIVFKLFGKDPSSFPGNLRDQILNWLSHSPSEIESYIRPGCVVLSIYMAMPSIAWAELEQDLLQHVLLLIRSSESDFWKKGRFLVRTNRQLISHKDGTIRLCKSWRTWSSPELISVSPVAVVGGQKTPLVLKGRNLTVPGTKIHCTYMGKYTSKDVLCSSYPGTIYDDSCVESFEFPEEPSLLLGRCFIEVENGFKGNSFPVIITSSSICRELRTLELEIEENGRTAEVILEDRVQDNALPRSREDVLHFLHELGWLFQRAKIYSAPPHGSRSNSDIFDFSIIRFKHLFMFAIERDWCALIKELLDILVERCMGSDSLSQESLEMLLEIHLLNRAVKRKCKKMVELLLEFVVVQRSDNSKMYPFPPNLPGPRGVTPLHLAACTQHSEEMVDALTNDPQEIGLSCWNTLRDDNGQSPHIYAAMKNNHSYNELVAQKLADKKNGQVSILVGAKQLHSNRSGAQALEARSCAECAGLESRLLKGRAHSRLLLQRPYVLSVLGIAAVCVCVGVFVRALIRINSGRSFKWEDLDYGSI